MREKEEDMLIALYITGEGKKGFDEAHMKKCFKILSLMASVRERLKEEQEKENFVEYISKRKILNFLKAQKKSDDELRGKHMTEAKSTIIHFIEVVEKWKGARV